MPQIRAAARSCTAPGSGPHTPHDVTARAGDDLQVHPVAAVLAGVERPVGGDPVDGDQRAVDHHVGVPGFPGPGQCLPQFRGPGGQQGHRLGDVAVAVPTPNPPARSANVSARFCRRGKLSQSERSWDLFADEGFRRGDQQGRTHDPLPLPAMFRDWTA